MNADIWPKEAHFRGNVNKEIPGIIGLAFPYFSLLNAYSQPFSHSNVNSYTFLFPWKSSEIYGNSSDVLKSKCGQLR